MITIMIESDRLNEVKEKEKRKRMKKRNLD